MRQYLDLLTDIMQNGVDAPTRSGDARSVFGRTMRFKMADDFPALTTKKLAFRSVLAEDLWMLAGDNDVRHLHEFGIHIWDGNAYAPYWEPKAEFPGDAGRHYGKQWRDWRGPEGERIDQIQRTFNQIVKERDTGVHDRRNWVQAWNPAEADKTCLPPCHAEFQFYVAGRRLSIAMTQRSCDMFLGVPFNIAQYALMLHIFAQMTGLEPYEFIHELRDAHTYHDHLEAVKEQLSREPYPLPQLSLTPDLKRVDDLVLIWNDALVRVRQGEKPGEVLDSIAHLENYQSHPTIKAKMAVGGAGS